MQLKVSIVSYHIWDLKVAMVWSVMKLHFSILQSRPTHIISNLMCQIIIMINQFLTKRKNALEIKMKSRRRKLLITIVEIIKMDINHKLTVVVREMGMAMAITKGMDINNIAMVEYNTTEIN
jgi:hypothetical protein